MFMYCIYNTKKGMALLSNNIVKIVNMDTVILFSY